MEKRSCAFFTIHQSPITNHAARHALADHSHLSRPPRRYRTYRRGSLRRRHRCAALRAHAGARVLVVSHKATIRLLLGSLLGFDARRDRDNLDQRPCALNIVDLKDPVRARVTLFNDTSRYAAEGLAIPNVPTARL